MADLKLVLQEFLLNKDKSLYDKSIYQEIIQLVKSYKNDMLDKKNYEIYFNKKCIVDYEHKIMGEIIKLLEPTLMQKKKSKKMIEMIKSIHIVQELLKRKKFEKYINKVDSKLLLKYYEPYNKMKKELDVLSELKDKEQAMQMRKRINVLKTGINKIVNDKINELYKDNKFTYTYLSTTFESIERSLINFIINVQKKLIEKTNVVTFEYLDLLISQFTEKNTTFIKFINEDDLTKDFIIDEDLAFYLVQYKYLQQVDFNYFFGLLLDMSDDRVLTTEQLKKIGEQDVDELKYTHKDKLLLIILIEIFRECEIPHDQEYMVNLKKFYYTNGLISEYDEMENKSIIYRELIKDSEDIFAELINRIKNKENVRTTLTYILKSYVKGDITLNEYNELLGDYKTIVQISKNPNNSYIILNQHLNTIMSNDINSFVSYKLTRNINSLKASLKKFEYDDEYIKQQLELFYNESKIVRKEKSKRVMVYVKPVEKTDIFLRYMKWVKRSKQMHNILKINIKDDIETIFNNIIAKIMTHYIKAIQNFMKQDEEHTIRELHYYHADDVEIKVNVKNSLEDIILKAKNEGGEYGHFIGHSIINFLENHKFYSKIFEEEINLYDIIKEDKQLLLSLYRVIELFNTSMRKNKLKQVSATRIKKDYMKFEEEKYKNQISELMSKKKYQALVKANKTHKVLTKDEVRVYMFNMDSVLFKKTTVKSKNKIDDKNTLKMIKQMIDIISQESLKKNVNVFKKQIYNKHDRRVITDANNIINDLVHNKFKIPLLTQTRRVPKSILIGTIGTNIVSEKHFEENDVGFLELQNLKKAFANSELEQEYIEIFMANVVRLTYSNLNNIFGIKMTKKNFNEIIKVFQQNNLKVESIKRKILRAFDFDVKAQRGYTNMVLTNMLTLYAVVQYIEHIITNNEKDFHDKLIKIINDKINVTTKTDIVGNQVLIKGKKYNYIGKVIKKESGNRYMVKRGKNNLIVDKKDIFNMPSLKGKMCLITKGVNKGKVCQIISSKLQKFLTMKEKHTHEAYIERLKSHINDTETHMKKRVNFEEIDQEYMPYLIESRKRRIKQLKDKKMKLMLKVNLKINKALTQDEIEFIKSKSKLNVDRMRMSLKNLKNKLRIANRKRTSVTYTVRMDYGQTGQKIIRIRDSQVKINLKEIELREKIEEMSLKFSKQGVDTSSIYKIINYIYNNVNQTRIIHENINPILYYQMLYSNVIDMFNNNKMVKVNKVKIFLVTKEKEGIMKRNKEKILNKLKKVKTRATKIKLMKMLKENEQKSKKLKMDKKVQDISGIIIENNIMVKKFSNDLSLEKISKKEYILFKENKELMKKDMVQEKKIQKVQDEDEEKQRIKMVDSLIERGSNIFDNFILNINSVIKKCNILDSVKNITDNVYDKDFSEEDIMKMIQEDLDFDDEEEKQFGEFQIPSPAKKKSPTKKKTPTPKKKTPSPKKKTPAKKLSWLELAMKDPEWVVADSPSDDSEFDDSDFDDEIEESGVHELLGRDTPQQFLETEIVSEW